jgi:hypothetical protein
VPLAQVGELVAEERERVGVDVGCHRLFPRGTIAGVAVTLANP